MSISVTKIVNLSQAALKFLVQDETEDESSHDYKTIGGVFSDSDYAWLASGPGLEIVQTKTGNKIGAWSFGWILKDSHTEVVCVDEIQRPSGRQPLLAVGLDCDFSGGMICIFDFLTSRVIRAIHITDKITSLHVIDAGYDVFTLPGPLRNFDGIIAVGTAGGNVFLVDICRQICDEALTTGGLNEVRDELNPCMLSNISIKDLGKIEQHKEFAVRNSEHLAIHLNIVFDKSTKHFTLKGPKGEDRIHVNKDEVIVSALYYCPQLGSLLVGYNFGAFQMYNLMNLTLVYTSPVCDEHIPISHFAIQEPADDPRAVCYIWSVYSGDDQYATCLPIAVMYSFCYQTKEYHEGYGCLYQDFYSASVQYQMELGVPSDHKRVSKQRGGNCLKVNVINQGSVNREGIQCDLNEDNLTLCVFVWDVSFTNHETNTFLAIFDLNQWYKEQMPNIPNSQHTSVYMLHILLNDLINSATNRSTQIFDIHINKNSVRQFTTAQRLEEHFYPSSITFGMTCLRESDIIFLQNYGVQKALLAQIESLGPLCLVEPAEIYQEVINLGLVPLFIDLPDNTPISTNQQREIILGATLENHLIGWLCKCASEWANGRFLSTGCSLDFLISWAFQRAVTLKTNCDKFCTALFDYSEVRLDNNTIVLLNNCTRQLKSLYSLYAFFMKKLSTYISNYKLVEEQYKSLETISVYFEVLQWLLNVGLLPECPLAAYPRSDDMERINAPYPAEMLIDFYNHRRALLKILNEENFSTSESVLFIDALIGKECGGKILQEQWRNDGGNGLYPPPSLQALLRTYLIDNVDFSYKHSVIIYVFLDLAMTLDQERYKSVITHLIKFPAVFKVSPSFIKITQAFWQLDHCDYNTAMGLLLDPLISLKDLKQWHHKIVLRALILQKQHNFALLYVQVRKPVLQDDDDILSTISLYVANNMLDEAFYFEKHYTGTQGDKFLMHLFNECKKNDKLRCLIYRSFSPSHEEFFLNYLKNTNQSTSDDLLVYYHILRSHFIEAFQNHDRSVPNQIEKQGLFGQENAIPRDKLVYILKKLLPNINRNLLNLYHKEKNNIWQQVSRPTPMSVFVHNLTENVQYKSTIIGAALAKAKQTFNESIGERKLDTETTPFLRTPTVSATSKRLSSVVVNPKVIDADEDETDGPSPAKRLKLSPRINTSFSSSIPSKLDTPVVKRKTPRIRGDTAEREASAPHSILKIKSLVNRSPRKDGDFEDDFNKFEKLEYTPVSSTKRSGLGLSPRRSLAKTSSTVRFEGVKSTSSSNLDSTRSLENSLLNISSGKMSSLAVKGDFNEVNASSKETSTEGEAFYTPENSLEKNDDQSNHVNEGREAASDLKLKQIEVSLTIMNEDKEEDNKEKLILSPINSFKGRRSYKRSLEPTMPVRSSPRLSRNAINMNEMPLNKRDELKNSISDHIPESVSSPVKIIENTNKESLNEPSVMLPTFTSSPIKTGKEINKDSISEPLSSSPMVPKLRPRKSLCRKVLEVNALNSASNSPVGSPKTRKSKRIDSPKIQKETVKEVVLESTTKYRDGEEVHKSNFTEKHNITTSFVDSESDVSESDYSIKMDQPKLSESIMKFLMTDSRGYADSNKSVIKRDESKDNDKDKDKEEGRRSRDEEDINRGKTEVPKTKNVEDNENQQLEFLPIDRMGSRKSVTFDSNSTTDVKKRFEYSVLDKSNISGLKLFDSVACDSRTHDEDVEETEVMDVDVDIVVTENSKNKSDQLLYTTLRSVDGAFNESSKQAKEKENSKSPNKESANIHDSKICSKEGVDEIQDDDDDEVVIVTEESKTENSKNESDEPGYTTFTTGTVEKDKEISIQKENIESSDGETTTNRPIDPEMNVFEISDDLSFNDGLIVEKEVTLGENDLCYGQQNTLESVLEENVNSTALNVFEKNVFNTSYEEESGEEGEETQAEPQVIQEYKDESQGKSVENEVIEIGSSTDEDSKSEGDDTPESYSPSNDENEALDISYEKNIYDSDNDYSSENSYECQHTDTSDNKDAGECDETKEGFGLFEGDFVYCDDEEEKKVEGEQEQDKERQLKENKVIDERKIENIQHEEIDIQDAELGNQMDDDDDEGQTSNLATETVNTVITENISKTSEEMEGEENKEQSSEIKDREENQVAEECIKTNNELKENEESCNEIIDKLKDKEENNKIEEYEETHSELKEKEQNKEIVDEDNSVEMDELNYSVQETFEKGNDSLEDKTEKEKDTDTESYGEQSQSTDKPETKIEPCIMKIKKIQKDELAPGNIEPCVLENRCINTKEHESSTETESSIVERKLETILEESTPRDLLTSCPIEPVETDVLTTDSAHAKDEDQDNVPRKRSTSVSSPGSEKSVRTSRRIKDKDVNEEDLMPGRITRSKAKTSFERDILDQTSVTTKTTKSLRPRRSSTEEKSTPALTLRKRSASVGEKSLPTKEQTPEREIQRSRSRRATSVVNLPKIPEENTIDEKQKSIIEDYSMHRRLTRQQASLLKKMEESQHDMKQMKPVVVLDKADLEEPKIYDSSPTTTNSTISSVKPTRRLRSTSQTSETSQRSGSKTPVRSLRSQSRKKSTDESESNTSKKQLQKSLEETEKKSPPRTRSGAKFSISDQSDDSSASQSVKLGKRRRSVSSQSALSDIQEDKSEKSKVPKKRTRKNSSQI